MKLVPRKNQEVWFANPFSELESIQNEMNRMFNFSLGRYFDQDSTLLGSHWAPAIDVFDSQDSILVKAEIPGLKKDEIDVSIQDNTLIIKGEKKQENEVKEGNYCKTERYYGSFYRAVALPSSVDTEKTTANYKEGVLELTLTKKEEAKPKQIKVDVK